MRNLAKSTSRHMLEKNLKHVVNFFTKILEYTAKSKKKIISYQNNNDLLKKQSISTYYTCSWHRTTSTGSSYGLKCLTSFFSEGSMLGETTLVIFLLSFRTLLGCCSVLCVGFSVHVAQQDFYYFKGYQFGGLVFV